ncbi:Gfo/Idh/MocA family protein [Parapedobacter tibetensis]|uniref:Gfo/Idh/MocA family protein n=1 Tax=Parapedobacter tibetensis TaxID=2972951 RepID=UPI00214D2EFC|nr:Gfo/Idh/MocA family oxidoreductase [Parapedobacter tibetensis]
MKRSDFIKQAGTLGAGMFLANESLAKTISHAQNQNPIGAGIIGCGDRGKGIMHTMNATVTKNFKPLAYCDVLDFRLDEAKQYAEPSAKSYRDYRKLLDNQSIQAVFIAVPLSEHFRVAKDAILAGKHVYLEKTMTFTIPEAMELVELVKAHPKQTFQVGYQYRYSPLYFKVKEMIDSGYLGKVSQIDCRWDRNNNWRRRVPDPSLERQVNWRLYREYSGGLAAELLTHQMDFIHWTFDTVPDEIMGYGGIDIYNDGRETFDNIQLTLRYKSQGIIGNFGTTLGNARDGYLFKIKGTKGFVSLSVNTGVYYPEDSIKITHGTVDGVTGATKIVQNSDGGIPILPEPTKDGTIYALEEFYKSIMNGTIPSSNVHTGAKGAICSALANESLFSGNIQHWKPEYNL